jgi:phage tail protein X
VRIALWLLVLVTVCAALLLWNERVSVQARAERAALREAATRAEDGSPTGDEARGFGHVIVGEKSGAPLLEPEPPPAAPHGAPPAADPRNAHKDAPPKPASSEDASREAHYVVAPGESLSTICQRHYGSSRPDVVAAVAHANKLEKADQIRAGMKIVLPAGSALLKSQH